MAASTVINLAPILDPLVQTAGLVLTGFAGWALTRVAQFAHISLQASLKQSLLDAIDRGISYAQSVVQADVDTHSTVTLTNQQQATAVAYVVQKMPDTMKSLGMSATHVADLVTAKLPQ